MGDVCGQAESPGDLGKIRQSAGAGLGGESIGSTHYSNLATYWRNPGAYLQWYENIEKRLLEVLSLIPFIKENYNMFSPRFPSLLTETGDVLDSLFCELSEAAVSVGGITKEKKDLKIGDYGWLYADKLKLPDTRSLSKNTAASKTSSEQP